MVWVGRSSETKAVTSARGDGCKEALVKENLALGEALVGVTGR
jgi:hypothetical protein